MRNSIISRNHRLWVAVLSIAVVFYGNLSCKVTERSLLPPDVEESGEGAENSSVGEASGDMSVASGSNDPVTDCLQEGARWLMRVDGKEFSRHFSKLICRYIIYLIRESPSQDPVMSLESLCEFVSRLGVKLKMREVAMSGDMGSAIDSESSPAGTRICVVDDIGWDSQFDQNLDKGVFFDRLW